MKIKKILKILFPEFIYNQIRRLRYIEIVETLMLNAEREIKLDTTNLLHKDKIDLVNIFDKNDTWKAWKSYENKFKVLSIPDLTGGVNLGDRKALFFLICYFKPKSVLEVGTHIGASTVHICGALDYNKKHNNISSNFSTLDIRDVNCNQEKPWLQFKSPKSPQALLDDLNLNINVDFLVNDSLDYLETSDEFFDLIFLDGDHFAKIVYKEVPKALKKLKKGGIILLHDYFKKGDSANPNNNLNSGPYLAIQRHISEGANIEVKTLGKLPWKTKYDSYITSLALLLKK